MDPWKLIATYGTRVITVPPAVCPEVLAHLPQEELDAQAISGVIGRLEKPEEAESIILVTDADAIAQLVQILNQVRQANFVTVIHNGQIEADQAIAEFQKMNRSLVSPEGEVYTLERELAPGVWFTENGRVFFDETVEPLVEVADCTPLYTSRSAHENGKLLPDAYSSDTFRGRIADHMRLDVFERMLALHCLFDGLRDDVIPDDVLYFDGGQRLSMRFASKETHPSLEEFLALCLFGEPLPENGAPEFLISRICNDTYPDYILDFLEEEFLMHLDLPFEICKNIISRFYLERADCAEMLGGEVCL